MRKRSGEKKTLRKKVVRSKRPSRRFKEAPTSPKIYTQAQVGPASQPPLTDLPFSYGQTQLVLLVRDPYWAYSYWDFSGETWNWIQSLLKSDSRLKPVMRIHDLDRKHVFDLLISLEAKNWYLHLGIPDHRFVAELGLGDGDSKFHLIARSNEVRTPRDCPSDQIDPEWNDRDFTEIYRLSGGGDTGLSSPGSLFIPRQA